MLAQIQAGIQPPAPRCGGSRIGEPARQRSLSLQGVERIGAATGAIFLSPNEKRIAENRRDLYRLCVVTHCDTAPNLEDPIKDPARFPWHEVKKIEHYRLDVNAMTQPMVLKEDAPAYGGEK